jgi:hypothetical protein
VLKRVSLPGAQVAAEGLGGPRAERAGADAPALAHHDRDVVVEIEVALDLAGIGQSALEPGRLRAAHAGSNSRRMSAVSRISSKP